MLSHNSQRITQPRDAGVPVPIAAQTSDPTGQGTGPAGSVPTTDATTQTQTAKPDATANPGNAGGLDEIERIASAVDLAIALEDN